MRRHNDDRRNGSNSTARRPVLRTLGIVSVAGLAGCLSDGDEEGADQQPEGVDSAEAESDNGGDDDGDSETVDGSVGAAEISFGNEVYTFDDASCDGSRTHPPENEQIRHRDVDVGIEFWVERHDPDESDAVDVHLTFPSGDPGATIGETEAYSAQTTIDDVEFELGRGTSGTLHLEPSTHMNDDVDHDPDGGEITWEIAC